jgi:hypothetical protein
MSFYTDLRSDAYDLLKDFGRDVSVITRTAGAYSTATGTTTVTETTNTTKGVIIDRRTSEIDGTMIMQGDKKAILSQVGLDEININDLLSFGSNEYVVTDVQKKDPAGENVIFVCNIRGLP